MRPARSCTSKNRPGRTRCFRQMVRFRKPGSGRERETPRTFVPMRSPASLLCVAPLIYRRNIHKKWGLLEILLWGVAWVQTVFEQAGGHGKAEKNIPKVPCLSGLERFGHVPVRPPISQACIACCCTIQYAGADPAEERLPVPCRSNLSRFHPEHKQPRAPQIILI